MMTHSISNSDDVIDSRDVIERIEELQETDDADEIAERGTLERLADEASGYAADWTHGEVLIRETYFTEYCKEMLEDCGDLPENLPHYIEIDWEATASNLRVDYTEVEFDGVAYLVR
jgi:antirestriction protein